MMSTAPFPDPSSAHSIRTGPNVDSLVAHYEEIAWTEDIGWITRYRKVRLLGTGGQGAVYLADDQVLKRQVVIKALLSDNDPEMAAQSVKEREFLAAIKHASIVSIYDFLTIGTQGYIVMEYVHGKTLDQIMEDQGRPFAVQ